MGPLHPLVMNGAIMAGQPSIGVWLMPDNQSTGELEDFVAQMIPPGDPVWPRSEYYIEGIPEPDRKFTDGQDTESPNSRLAGSPK